MPLISCPTCASDELQGEALEDGRIRTTCLECGHTWDRGESRQRPAVPRSTADLRQAFQARFEVSPSVRARVDDLKAQFLADRPAPRPEVAVFWAKYQRVFSRDGLVDADPQDLKDFANSSTGANPGNMSVFNTAWNEMGPSEAAARTKDAVRYLLYGPDAVPLEDRLTQLIEGDRGFGMTGFREALLTKVLCIVQPDRFLPIVKYTGVAGKKEIAAKVFGLRLPEDDAAQWTIGRLVLWSNDLLVEAIGGGFVDQAHAAAFLWWAKDQG